MIDKKLYTTQEIAEIYDVTPYTITQNWIPKGLKYIHGKRRGYVYRLEWVEDFIENSALVKENKKVTFKSRPSSGRNKSKQFVV